VAAAPLVVEIPRYTINHAFEDHQAATPPTRHEHQHAMKSNTP
jgi:hypothetical protein